MLPGYRRSPFCEIAGFTDPRQTIKKLFYLKGLQEENKGMFYFSPIKFLKCKNFFLKKNVSSLDNWHI